MLMILESNNTAGCSISSPAIQRRRRLLLPKAERKCKRKKQQQQQRGELDPRQEIRDRKTRKHALRKKGTVVFLLLILLAAHHRPRPVSGVRRLSSSFLCCKPLL
jgi:hypothetical protein